MREAAAAGDHVNLSINGQSQVPPGFRFHPTEEELLHYYLRKKVASDKIDLDVIREVDLNKLEPWDIQERCKIGSTPQNDWYFFSHKDKKYPTGTRTNRATAAGFWKATGRDKIIYSGYKRIGLRKTLVFYKGRAPHGQKSDWIMHEYRLDEASTDATTTTTNTTALITSSPGLMSNSGSYIIGGGGGGDQGGSEEGWVVCRVFRKKNYQKSLESPRSGSSPNLSNILHHHHNQLAGDSKSHVSMTSSPSVDGGDSNGVLDQILMYMGKQQRGNGNYNNTDYCKAENYDHNSSFGGNNSSMRALLAGANEDHHLGMRLEERFMHLPRLVADHEHQHHQQQQQQQQHGHTSSSICYQSFSDEAMVTVTTEENNSIINNNNHNNNNHNHKYISNNEASCTNQGTGFDVTSSGNDNKGRGRGAGGMNMMMSQQQQVIVNDWVALDRLVASQLNGHLHDEVDLLNDDDDDDHHDDNIGHHHHHHHTSNNGSNGNGMHMDLDEFRSIPHHHHHSGGSSSIDNDLIWTNFTKSASSPSSSSDPLCHLSV